MPASREVFISYRRQDSGDVTGRIFDKLNSVLGKEVVFRDVDSIQMGRDFDARINTELESCKMAIVVIGPEWLTLTDENGNRRIDQKEDYVRREIEAVLSREPAIPCIPILIKGAAMPGLDELPESIRPLTLRQSVEVRGDPHFHSDFDKRCCDARSG